MTNQTVPVPVELLQALKEGNPIAASRAGGPIAALARLIPNPPKVGDVLTAEKIAALPPKSVLRDRDDDLWVTTERGPVYLMVRAGTVEPGSSEDYDNPVAYAAVLVSLPRD